MDDIDEMARALADANSTAWGSLSETCCLGSLDGALGTRPFWRRLARAALQHQAKRIADTMNGHENG